MEASSVFVSLDTNYHQVDHAQMLMNARAMFAHKVLFAGTPSDPTHVSVLKVSRRNSTHVWTSMSVKNMEVTTYVSTIV